MRTIQDINDVKTYQDFLDFANGDVILCNNIGKDFDKLELENGSEFNEYDEYKDIYQYYIISDDMAGFIKQFTDEILFYHNELDVYVWAITHYGTSWNSVDIEIKKQ